ESLHPKTYFMTKAEHDSVAVATASVIARASFLKEMDKLSSTSGYALLKGDSNKVDQLASQFIKNKGENYLSEITKISYAHTEKGIKLTYKTRNLYNYVHCFIIKNFILFYLYCYSHAYCHVIHLHQIIYICKQQYVIYHLI